MRAFYNNPYLVLALASLCWSGNHLMGRAIAGHVPPLTITTLRWLLAALILLPFIPRTAGARLAAHPQAHRCADLSCADRRGHLRRAAIRRPPAHDRAQ